MAGQCHLARCGLSNRWGAARALPAAMPVERLRARTYFARPSFSMITFSVFMVSTAYCL